MPRSPSDQPRAKPTKRRNRTTKSFPTRFLCARVAKDCFKDPKTRTSPRAAIALDIIVRKLEDQVIQNINVLMDLDKRKSVSVPIVDAACELAVDSAIMNEVRAIMAEQSHVSEDASE